MSYTNIEIVRKYITFGNLPGGWQKNYVVTFSGLEEVDLPGHSIIEDSVVVKAMAKAEPVYEKVTLADSEVSLAHNQLVPNSMAVASDSSLGTVYVENVDYAVDYSEGKVVRIDGGGIGSGSSPAVWYNYYIKYTENTDYTVGHQIGTIKRLAGSAIQVGQTVLIDYQLLDSMLNDEIINEAVNQANAIVENEVDTDQSFGADLVLQTAATYLAVSLLCRVEASGCLRYSGSGSTDAKSWLLLAESYRTDFDRLIKMFRPGAARMSHPTNS